MIDKLNARMIDLSEEAEVLINKRSELHDEIEKINVRLAHLVGAMQELDSLKRSLEDGNAEEKQV
jgi:prefoldin subunit 5